ncbi:PQQ-dependent sugar dehydrogenase [Granulosicoccus antarcticus]|uniref:Soluble aldose sugar dehydrogenase YliI n=1 Tax=Granulosicoccus antarcticus IMCC3135 TaxID=1192854 RepID=A0A2Z2NZC8_9GAMM|nr:PQQ-dependent sugar dehydrogenase [Granulosicoccus antarcticus]ASJ72474.1 Soluble aldose sugar dehydrogenase YliI [Granulosicoccus antarcticus IMCC3135]
MLIRIGAVLFTLLSQLPGTALAIELPEGFIDEAYISGLDGQITGFDASAAGRVFISEKAGIVRVFQDGQLLAEPFLDINEIVNDRVDRGMLSVAVHPQFPLTPFVYVLYTYDPPELVSNGLEGPGTLEGNGNRVSRLVRYTADPARDFNVAVEGSAEVILGRNSTYEAIGEPEGRYNTTIPSCGPISDPTPDCLPVDEDSHTIGAMRFAEDGSLYVSNGDGASYRSFEPLTEMALNLNSLRGKILRIDPETGKGLSDNPYFDGDPDSNRSRVISTGLRNPYSMTIHPLTGQPYVGDVGEKQWEEINGGSSKNFGWPCYEGGEGGNLRQPGFEPLDFCQALYQSSEEIEAPLLSWEHLESGSSAMVGDFYFGEAFPSNYSGMLFYGDFIQGWMRYADVSDPDNVTSFDFASDMQPMTEIRVGEDGALYYASIITAEVRRIRYIGEDGGGESPEPEPTPEPGPDSTDNSSTGEGAVEVGAVSILWLVSLGLSLCLFRRKRSCVNVAETDQ